jgi:ABC transport system ATP-binding/permease protein
VLVTHDRYLLDRVSTEILALDGEGHAHALPDYAQWERTRETLAPPAAQPKPTPSKAAPAPVRRLSTAEQRELAGMETAILEAEAEVSRLHDRLAEPAIAADHVEARAVYEAYKQAQDRVATLYARWEDLESRLAK